MHVGVRACGKLTEVGTAGFVAPVAAVINSVAARGRAYAVAIVTLVLVAVTVACEYI